MEYRRLGNSGLKVSVIGLGTWLTFGRSIDEDRALQCLRAAIDAGINFIDTADVYAAGAAEACLGRLLEGIRRADIVLATKVFFPMSEGVNDRGLSRKHIFESCHDSLSRLRTDYIDLYQCHRHDPDTPIFEVVRAMDDLIRQGKIHYWGVSCWEPEQIGEACEIARDLRAAAPISNQPLYNMLEREVEEAVIPECRERGLSQVAFSPLCQGVLTGKYLDGAIPEGSRAANDDINRFLKQRLTEENMARVRQLMAVAEELGVALPALALAWCLRETNVASVIAGASRPKQVVENAAAADLVISEEAGARIDAILTEQGA